MPGHYDAAEEERRRRRNPDSQGRYHSTALEARHADWMYKHKELWRNRHGPRDHPRSAGAVGASDWIEGISLKGVLGVGLGILLLLYGPLMVISDWPWSGLAIAFWLGGGMLSSKSFYVGAIFFLVTEFLTVPDSLQSQPIFTPFIVGITAQAATVIFENVQFLSKARHLR